MKGNLILAQKTRRRKMKVIEQYQGRNFTFYNGDSCEILKSLPDDSIHFSIFSPPFMDLYTYSD